MAIFNLEAAFALYCVLGSILFLESANALCDGGDSCCDGRQCGLGEGDCDSDTSCAGKLKCGTDNCVGEFFDATDDCCYSAPETTEKPKSSIDIIGSVVDCTAIGDAQLIIRNTRIAFGCDIGNPTITLNTCSQISCLQDIVEKSVSCARETEKMDCPSLQKVSAALLTVSKQYCDGPDGLVCSAPVGSSGGDAFSDEEFNSPGSKVTAIKIRVGGAGLDYIQAYYDGQAGPINGGTGGPGTNVYFTVPAGTEIVAASGTVSTRWGYVSSIKFITSDGKVHGPFGHDSEKSWKAEGREGSTLAFLKGRSGDALDQLSLCWR